MQGVWILSLSLAAVCAIAVDYSRQGSWIKSSRFARGAIIFLGIGLAAALRKATVIPQLFLVLVVERRWPRQRDDLLSTEKVRCGMWDMLKKSEDFLLYASPLALVFYTDYLHSYSLERIGTPLLVQALVFLLVLDLKDYWMHRLQHVVVFFWRFHKIHHASEEVSILAATRDHLSYWVEQFVTNGIIILGLGVNAYAVLLAFLAKGLVNTLNHTNVDFPKLQAGFPWWAYVVSTPNYHAWHHTVTCRKDGNLADVFPLWDIVFGTFERPRGSSANWEFGLDEKERLPDRLVEQLWYPIGQAWKGLRARSVADADRARV